MDEPADDLFTTLRPALENGIPFVKRMGLTVEALAPGRVKLRAPLEPNVNHIGTMYAGALFTLAEILGGALFLSTFDASRYYPVIKGMEIKFVRAATTDITVTVTMAQEEVERIQAAAEEAGKADYSFDTELLDAEGTLVCVTTNHYQLRRHGI